MNSVEVLRAENLEKRFNSGDHQVEVLKSVDLHINASESLSIMGDSGCGKSTLLNLVARLEVANGGEVFWEGQKMHATSKADSRTVNRRGAFLGVIYQSYYLIPELTVLENVIMASRLLGNSSNKYRDRAVALLEAMGVAGKANEIPGKLSGGERQRVAIARSLINRPKLILADEPTGNLDERTGGEVMDLLLQSCQQEEAALILVTHNPKFAVATDFSMVMRNGKLHEQ